MAEAARGLAARGYRTEVLTSCAVDHYTWANALRPGVSEDRGVTVRRFETELAHSLRAHAALAERIHAEDDVELAEEVAFLSGPMRVPDLCRWLARHSSGFDAIVFSPYLNWTTVFGASVDPDRSIVMPCLHDEPQAYLRIVAAMLSEAAGVWFLSEPEHQLGHRITNLPARHHVVGAAVDVPCTYDAAGFRARHRLSRPFLLYAGRREDGKGWRSLASAFGAAVLRHDIPFDLVTVGVGVPWIPSQIEDRVIDLAYLDATELPHAFAAAAAYIQPSRHESFSRTVMESWLAGTPVIATASGEVVNWHCERSGGGLSYGDTYEFAECLRFLAEAPEVAAELAARGREYVLDNYTWPVVLDSMEQSLRSLRSFV
jgi:glycosyltransferase involved in cell wall biosynthesis